MQGPISRNELRKLLDAVLKTDSAFNAFCIDHFVGVARQFASGQDHTDRLNLLFLHEEPDEILDRLKEQYPSEVAFFGPAGSLHDALGAALRLDRTDQWAAIIERCHQAQNAVFLLQGQRERAGLVFFIERICRFLGAEKRDHHRVFKVPFLVENSGPQSSAEWELRLHGELAQGLGRTGPLEQLLSAANARQPFFIVLGRQPLSSMSQAEQGGLKDFLVNVLPLRLARTQHIRLLIPTDYTSAKDSLATQLIEWARAGASRSAYRFIPLPEAELPEWRHVLNYLQEKDVPETRIAAIKQGYEKMTRRKSVSYYDLTTFLDRTLDG